MIPDRDDVTGWLVEWRAGEPAAVDRLVDAVYDELRRIARRLLRHEPRGQTFQPTDLVHEAYFRLSSLEMSFRDRVHFFAVAARFMRRILVDAAKRKRASKRGGGVPCLPLRTEILPAVDRPARLVALDDALNALAKLDRGKSLMVEVRYFGGLTLEETAELCGVSRATVERELKVAKAYLYRQLGRGAEETAGAAETPASEATTAASR